MAGTKDTATKLGRDATEKLREQMAASDLTKKAKDAAYTLVGLGVMGAQRASSMTKSAAKQMRVDEATKGVDLDAMKARTEDAKALAKRQLVKADDVLGDAFDRIEEAFAPLEERLPDGAKDTVGKFRDASKHLHAHVRTRFVEPVRAEAKPAPKATKKASTPKE